MSGTRGCLPAVEAARAIVVVAVVVAVALAVSLAVDLGGGSSLLPGGGSRVRADTAQGLAGRLGDDVWSLGASLGGAGGAGGATGSRAGGLVSAVVVAAAAAGPLEGRASTASMANGC